MLQVFQPAKNLAEHGRGLFTLDFHIKKTFSYKQSNLTYNFFGIILFPCKWQLMKFFTYLKTTFPTPNLSTFLLRCMFCLLLHHAVYSCQEKRWEFTRGQQKKREVKVVMEKSDFQKPCKMWMTRTLSEAGLSCCWIISPVFVLLKHKSQDFCCDMSNLLRQQWINLSL